MFRTVAAVVAGATIATVLSTWTKRHLSTGVNSDAQIMTPKAHAALPALFDMAGKVSLVTGGTGWLGTAFCEALAEAGSSVIISSRSRERAQEAAAKLPIIRSGQVHYGIELDHMDEDSIATGFQEALDVAGKVDVLVNNGLQGIDTAQGQKLDIESTTFDQFAKQQANNAGYFVLARALRDHVVSRGEKGSVIMIGSMYGQVASYPDAYEGLPYSSPVSYHSLKGGTIHLTRHLAAYWADDKIRVNCLSPGELTAPSSRCSRYFQIHAVLQLL
jgi:NAD(P)-dependent dehydrogenase (short-subunit alcohol dehydrogenase family)